MSERKHKYGSLDFMVCWQSLNGHLMMKYFETRRAATEHGKYLKKLGRAAEVWECLAVYKEYP